MIAIDGKFARKFSCIAVACACAAPAIAAPTGFAVSAGSASYTPATLTVTSTTARTQISWTNFSLAADEVFKFVQPSAQSSVLNHVFNPQSLRLLGGVSSNGSVLFMFNGMVSGSGMKLDLAGVIDTSLHLPRIALAMRGIAREAAPRTVATLADGSIYVISQDQQAVTAAHGEVVLNPGKTVELANASTPKLRVELSAPPAEAINLSRLVEGKGDSGIFAGLFRVPAAARQAAERDDDAVLTAAAQELPPTTPDIERFYRYALLFARLHSEARQDEGGMMKVAAAPTSRMLLPAARSRPSLLPQDIEIGAPARRLPEAAVAISSLPVPAAPELMATLEPQPIPTSGENESERNRVTLFALAPVLPTAELVATLEPQPIPTSGENESERNRVTLLALVPLVTATELVATLEPQPIAAAGENESERNRVTLVALAPVLPATELMATLEPQPIPTSGENESERNRVTLLALAPVQPEPSQTTGPESDRGQGRHERRSAPAVIVVAMAQHSATPALREDSSVKEVRIERRAPRYFTDYRGALFFM